MGAEMNETTRVALIVAWSDRILSRERERRIRYLLSAVSHDQITPRRSAGEGIR